MQRGSEETTGTAVISCEEAAQHAQSRFHLLHAGYRLFHAAQRLLHPLQRLLGGAAGLVALVALVMVPVAGIRRLRARNVTVCDLIPCATATHLGRRHP